jgi:hypothetical protein
MSKLKQGLLAAAVLALAACTNMGAGGGGKLALNGASEAPPNTSTATGTGSFTVGADKSVTGSVTVEGMTPTMAHLHIGAKGVAGPVIVPLVQSGNTFSAAPGAKMTDEQYAAYKAGNVYVNVHSKAFPPGEVRAQLTPN